MSGDTPGIWWAHDNLAGADQQRLELFVRAKLSPRVETTKREMNTRVCRTTQGFMAAETHERFNSENQVGKGKFPNMYNLGLKMVLELPY